MSELALRSKYLKTIFTRWHLVQHIFSHNVIKQTASGPSITLTFPNLPNSSLLPSLPILLISLKKCTNNCVSNPANRQTPVRTLLSQNVADIMTSYTALNFGGYSDSQHKLKLENNAYKLFGQKVQFLCSKQPIVNQCS